MTEFGRTSSKDEAYVEDEKARIRVIAAPESKKINIDLFITGTVLALRGRQVASGANVYFQVTDYCGAGFPPQKNLFMTPTEIDKLSLFDPSRHRRLIAIVSGLEAVPDQVAYYDMLEQFIGGKFGGAETMRVTLTLHFL